MKRIDSVLRLMKPLSAGIFTFMEQTTYKRDDNIEIAQQLMKIVKVLTGAKLQAEMYEVQASANF